MVHLLSLRAPSTSASASALPLLSGQRVLELGAGVGVLGCVAARLGAAQVLVTDRREVLHLIERNIALNELQRTAQAHELEWGHQAAITFAQQQQQQQQQGGFDVIIASDVIYNLSAAWLLLETLVHLSSERTLILIAYRERDPAEAEWFTRATQHFRISEETMHPAWKDAITFTPLHTPSRMETVTQAAAPGATISAAVKYASDTRPLRILRLQKYAR